MHSYVDPIVVAEDTRQALACFDRLLVLYERLDAELAKHRVEDTQAEDWAINLGPPHSAPYDAVRGVKFPAMPGSHAVAADLRYHGAGTD